MSQIEFRVIIAKKLEKASIRQMSLVKFASANPRTLPAPGNWGGALLGLDKSGNCNYIGYRRLTKFSFYILCRPAVGLQWQFTYLR
jgi:hypothetical protein